ncbi:MAG TPA: spore coat U domain-containing protein [Allosphingosinicella sp.]|nr:spore coat U domain-containing protein [Allosphingosinicella sp.]
MRRLFLPCAVAAAVSGGTAHAETSASFAVSAVIQPGCLVDGLGGSGNAGTIGTLDFGQASSLSTGEHLASLSAGQTIVLRCTPDVALTMTIDGGAHEDGGSRNLQLGSDGSARLTYALCADAGCAQPIGVGQPVGIAVIQENSNDVRLPVFGRLTLPGNRAAGTYTDTLTVTLSW